MEMTLARLALAAVNDDGHVSTLALLGTPDQKEGMAAFIEKRKAKFGGGTPST